MSNELKQCETNETCTPVKSEESFVKPQYTVREGEGAWEVGVVMPGVRRDKVEVSLDKDVLTVTGRVMCRKIGASFIAALRSMTTSFDCT